MNQKALIFLSFYILALLSPAVTMVDFAINQEEIAAEFCENKDKPKLNCEGKCHLSKMLAEQSKSEDEKSVTPNTLDYPLGKVDLLQLKKFPKKNRLRAFSFYSMELTFHFLSQIDHPPQA